MHLLMEKFNFPVEMKGSPCKNSISIYSVAAEKKNALMYQKYHRKNGQKYKNAWKSN